MLDCAKCVAVQSFRMVGSINSLFLTLVSENSEFSSEWFSLATVVYLWIQGCILALQFEVHEGSTGEQTLFGAVLSLLNAIASPSFQLLVYAMWWRYLLMGGGVLDGAPLYDTVYCWISIIFMPIWMFVFAAIRFKQFRSCILCCCISIGPYLNHRANQ